MKFFILLHSLFLDNNYSTVLRRIPLHDFETDLLRPTDTRRNEEPFTQETLLFLLYLWGSLQHLRTLS